MEIKRGKKLLLVEDEAIIAVVTSKMLGRNGYDVVTVNNGSKAIERALTDTSIDLILMDIDLGSGINGPEAARQILDIRNIPIVFLTSHSEQEVVEMVREITRYGYVIKNSGDFVLLSSIEMAFELFASHERLKASADYLRISEEKVRNKLESILSPEKHIVDLDLSDIIDIKMLQGILEDFNIMTGIGVGVVDLSGKMLVSAGKGGVCDRFHLVNSDSKNNCKESGIANTGDLVLGEYKLCKCKNNMWNLITPIEIGGKHAGNLFLEQFFFDDDEIDFDLFRSQGEKFGFDVEEYIKAIESVPKRGRETIFTAMNFYIRLLNIISRLSYSNIKLAKTLSERDLYSSLHRESVARLSEVTDHMIDLVARVDPDGRFQYVSPSYERTLGYGLDELLGGAASDLFHPSSRNKNIKDIAALCSAGEGFLELRLKHKDGTYLWFETTGGNVYDEEGNVTGKVLGARDITGRKKAEKKLSKKDKQYKDLFECMIDAFAMHEIVVDEWGNPVDYIFLEVNPSFENMTGLRAENVIGRRVTEVLPEIEPYWIAAYGQVALTGVQLAIENYSGALGKWFKVTAYSPERGYFATIFEDITERKKADELVKERDERYKRLFESVVGYVYTVFIENKIPVKTVHGPGCEAVTGYTPEDFISDPELWYKMIYPDDRGRVILFASDIINKGIFTPIEHRITCRDGSLAWVRNTPVPHFDDDKNLIEYDSVIADITARKTAEISLKESEELFSKAFFNGPLAMVLSEFETGSYIELNGNFSDITGYAKDEIMGKSPGELEFITESERGYLREYLLKNGSIKGREIRVKKKNGESIVCLYYGEIIIAKAKRALLSLLEDISEKKKTETKLREREALLWNIINSSPDCIFVKDTDRRLVLCNEVFAAAMGKNPAEMMGKNDIENGLIDEFNRRRGIKGYEEDDLRALSGEVVTVENEPCIVNGQVHYYDTIKIPLYRNGEVTSLLGISRDITERAAADKEKRAVIDLLRIINTTNGMHDLMKAIIVFMKNWSGCEAVGIRIREGYDFPYFESQGFPEQFIKLENSLCACDLDGQLLKDEIGDPVIECMCGNVICGRFDPSKPFFTEHGSFWSNCTTELLKTTTDKDRQTRTRNRCNGMGYESVALVPLKSGNKTFGLLQLNDKRKGMFTEKLIGLFERLGDNIAIALSEQFVRKELEESEARYRLIVEKNPLSILIIRNGKYIFANSSALERLGYGSLEDIEGLDFSKTISPEDMDEITGRTVRLLKGEYPGPMELKVVSRDGTVRLTEAISFSINLSDGPAVLIMGQDITAQKLLEKKIISREFRFNALTESSTAGIYFADKDGNFMYTNRSWQEMSGLTMEEARGDGWLQAVHSEDRLTVETRWHETVNSKALRGFEYRFLNKKGETVWVSSSEAPINNSEGEITGYVGTIVNITARKKAIERLIESESRFRNLFEHMPVAYQSLDSNGLLIDVNENWLIMTGYSRDEILGKSFGDFWTPETKDMFPERFKSFLVRGSIDDAEISITKKDGTVLTALLTGSVQKDFEGRLEKTHCVLIDISVRKEIEDVLRNREEFVSGVVNSLSALIAVLDEEGVIVAVNEAWKNFTKSDKGSKNRFYLGENYLNVFKNSDNVYDDASVNDLVDALNSVMRGDACQFFVEYPCHTEDRDLWFNVRVTKFTGGDPYLFVVAHEDITAMKEAEASIKSLLDEKELLLREVHHRIKNNMNTISGLLMLQAASINSEAAATALNDARNRVQSMMLMYDKLYRSEDYRKMNVKDYLEKFIDEIFVIFEHSRQIKIKKDIEDFVLDTKILFPLSIIINELITNAFKYAFPDGGDGEITVSVKKDDDKVTFSVMDNGKGFPDEPDASKGGGFGLNLVFALTEQIGGDVTIKHDNGTTVEVVFIQSR